MIVRPTVQTGFLDPDFIKYYEQSDNTRLADIAFYTALGESAGGVVLDAGCGSGRVLLPLLEVGVTVEGFDYSSLMLDVLKGHLSDRGLHARIWQDDLESADLEEGRYSLVLCTFNTFLHMMDHESQLAALKGMHRSLEPGGRLVLDITNPINFEIFSQQAIKRTMEASFFDGESETETKIWRHFDRDLIHQTGVYFREYETDGKPTHTTQIDFRWTFPEEMRLLLTMAGFERAEVEGDFEGEPLDEDSEMQVWTAWKSPSPLS